MHGVTMKFEDLSLVGCYTMSLGKKFRSFRTICSRQNRTNWPWT